MINNDRIVPVQKIDLISLYGTLLNVVLSAGGSTVSVLETTDVLGDFEVEDDGTFLANQPVKTLDFASGVSTATVYFVAGYDFAGITVNGAAATFAEESATVQPDGVTLYAASLASGSVTVAAVTPVIAES